MQVRLQILAFELETEPFFEFDEFIPIHFQFFSGGGDQSIHDFFKEKVVEVSLELYELTFDANRFFHLLPHLAFQPFFLVICDWDGVVQHLLSNELVYQRRFVILLRVHQDLVGVLMRVLGSDSKFG